LSDAKAIIAGVEIKELNTALNKHFLIFIASLHYFPFNLSLFQKTKTA